MAGEIGWASAQHRNDQLTAAAAAMAGQDDVARAALRELRRAQPNISLSWIAQPMPIEVDAD